MGKKTNRLADFGLHMRRAIAAARRKNVKPEQWACVDDGHACYRCQEIAKVNLAAAMGSDMGKVEG
ncbi:hypothetical protein [Blastomonas sp. UPD001]|uniref:hypothetical protein n=1 Tax=Blastomonas sp. UPD001 TaxID=2217673 RepID=UPI0013007E2E|nr:hypothetical protein [Blastomonas sp. UPD001]